MELDTIRGIKYGNVIMVKDNKEVLFILGTILIFTAPMIFGEWLLKLQEGHRVLAFLYHLDRMGEDNVVKPASRSHLKREPMLSIDIMFKIVLDFNKKDGYVTVFSSGLTLFKYIDLQWCTLLYNADENEANVLI